MPTLTDRQQAILDFLAAHIAAHGLPPTLAEIAAAFGFQQARAAHKHLLALQTKGCLELLPGKARGIRLREAVAAAPVGLPLVGRVAAGQPILADAHVERHIAVDPRLFRPRAHFLLRVRGESMRDAGILDGDFVAVHRSAEARSGQIVVARLEEEITLKRLELARGRVRLLSANPDFAPIEVDPRHAAFAIEGLYVGVVRAA